MTLKEREQTIKDLQEIVDNYSGSWQRFNVLDNALSLIKELTEEIKDLEADYDRVYEQAEADIRGNMADGGTSCHWCADKTKADTVKKMQSMIKEECIAGGIWPAFVARVVERVGEKLLEEENFAYLHSGDVVSKETADKMLNGSTLDGIDMEQVIEAFKKFEKQIKDKLPDRCTGMLHPIDLED